VIESNGSSAHTTTEEMELDAWIGELHPQFCNEMISSLTTATAEYETLCYILTVAGSSEIGYDIQQPALFVV